MPSGRSSRLDTAVNVAILATCILLAAVLGRRLWAGYEATARRSASVSVGDDLGSIPELGATPSRRLVLALGAQCQFCRDSSPAYSRLTQGSDFDVVVVSDDPEGNIAEHLRVGGIDVDRIVTPIPRELKIRGVPTTLVLDADNRVAAAWLGVVNAGVESEIRAALGAAP